MMCECADVGEREGCPPSSNIDHIVMKLALETIESRRDVKAVWYSLGLVVLVSETLD